MALPLKTRNDGSDGSDRPGWTGPLPNDASQEVVPEVLRGTCLRKSLQVEKPPAPYSLFVEDPEYERNDNGHLYLLRQKGIARQWTTRSSFEILGMYGPQFLSLEKCSELVGKAAK